MRINKYIANCNYCSRRKADELIEEGKVKINGKTAELGSEVNEFKDEVTVEGKKIGMVKEHTYLLLNKPKGYICTVSDDKGRKTVLDLIEGDHTRLYPVGRLDYDTEGLLILTDDGELTDRLTHPRNEVQKTYVAKIDGSFTAEMQSKLKAGIEIEDGVIVSAKSVRITETDKKFTKLELSITEGKNREIRRMFEKLNRNVEFLKRTKIGDLKLAGLDRGKYRKLTAAEIEYLKNI